MVFATPLHSTLPTEEEARLPKALIALRYGMPQSEYGQKRRFIRKVRAAIRYFQAVLEDYQCDIQMTNWNDVYRIAITVEFRMMKQPVQEVTQ
jgi:hypothetical protein